MPELAREVPWSRMLVAVGFSPLVVKTRLSAPRYESPEAASDAPPVAAELSQPRPGPDGGFAHGQPITPERPGSQVLANTGRSASIMLWLPLAAISTAEP